MELNTALMSRRSVRKFTEEPVSDAHIDALMHAAMSGPSACNKKPWAFYVVSNPDALARLRRTTLFTRMVAPLAIVVCGDMNHTLPRDMKPYWVQDCSAATENILLRAVDLGLGACWCGIHPIERSMRKVSEALELPENMVPLNIIFMGHPAENPEPRDQYDETRVHIIR